MSNLAKKILNELSSEDKETIRSWAEEAYVIRNDDSIPKNEKIKQLSSITNKNKIVLKFLKSFFSFIKRHTWDERGWAGRLTLGGLALGIAVSGTKMAGIATAGMGIGVPIYLLTSAGGALLGTIIQERSNKK